MLCGYLYAYIHFVTEVACFYFLSKVTNGSFVVWLIPFIYDALAFVPQGLVGAFYDKHPRINIAMIGTFLLFIACIMQFRFGVECIFEFGSFVYR